MLLLARLSRFLGVLDTGSLGAGRVGLGALDVLEGVFEGAMFELLRLWLSWLLSRMKAQGACIVVVDSEADEVVTL